MDITPAYRISWYDNIYPQWLIRESENRVAYALKSMKLFYYLKGSLSIRYELQAKRKKFSTDGTTAAINSSSDI